MSKDQRTGLPALEDCNVPGLVRFFGADDWNQAGRMPENVGPTPSRWTLQFSCLPAQIVRRYKKIYREAMQEWATANPQPVQEDDLAEDKGPKKSSPRRARPASSYALLTKAMDALEALREISGIDAPRQTASPRPSGASATPEVKDDELANMSFNQLMALESRLRAAADTADNSADPLQPEESRATAIAPSQTSPR